MKNKIVSFALILSFAGSMALAGEKHKNEKGASVMQPASATQDDGKNVNKGAKAKSLKSKSNNKTQEIPSEERQYQQALFAIYG